MVQLTSALQSIEVARHGEKRPPTDAELDSLFAALADTTRRQLLAALENTDFSLSAFAASRGITLTGLMKHLRVLENAGLVTRTKAGRVVRCELSAGPLQEAAVWLSRYQKFWTASLDALGRYLFHQQEIDPCPAPLTPAAPQTQVAAAAAATAQTASTPAKNRRSGSAGATRSRPPKSGKPGPTRKR